MQRTASKVLAGAAAVAVVALVTLAAIIVTDDASDQQVDARAAARARNAARAPGDVDGDGRTDLVVYRPDTSTFWVNQTRDGELGVPLGQVGDRPASGDFDGDGRADLVAVRAGVGDASGSWLVRSSSDGAQRTVSFGLVGDIPEPGDYDGDGSDDIAVFRPAAPASGAAEDDGDAPDPNAVWYVLQSSDGALVGIPFGIAGDLPAPGDYDGDGITDVAVQRGDTRWIRLSSDGSTQARHFGRLGDVPVIIDRDDDGRTDLAVVRPDGENQLWLFEAPGGESLTSFPFARATAPVQQRLVGDFDGDGRTEPAVFDPATAAFWIWAPTGVTTVPWGADGDLVLPLGVDPTLGLAFPAAPGEAEVLPADQPATDDPDVEGQGPAEPGGG